MNFDSFGEDYSQPQPPFTQPIGPDRGVRRRMWIAGTLAVIIVLLFIAERFVTLVQPNIERMQEKRDIASAENLQEDVERILNDFGIQPEWIRREKVKIGDFGHIRDQWQIKVPVDLPFASINLDMKSLAEEYQGKAFAIENAKEAQIALHIVFRKTIRYSLVFQPTRGLFRKTGRIVLLVDGIAAASGADIDNLIKSRENIAAILEPSKEAVALHTRLRAAERDVVLHLHFLPAQESGSRYELSENLRTEQIKNHLRYIVRNFPGCRAYYVTSERAPGLYLRVVEEEMKTQKVSKLESSLLNYIDRSTQHNVMSTRMNDLAALAAREGTAIGVVELRSNTLAFLETEMGRLRKKGYTFIRLPVTS